MESNYLLFLVVASAVGIVSGLEPCVSSLSRKQSPGCYPASAPACPEPAFPLQPPPSLSASSPSPSGSAPPRPTLPVPLVNDELIQAYKTIQMFKKTLRCDPKGITKTWSGGPEEICSAPGVKYQGFYCESPPGKPPTYLSIAAIDFNGFHLCSDAVGDFVSSFPNLAIFHANSNNFSGLVPASIANLTYFYELDISNNNFSGRFPFTLLPLIKLRFFDIRFNRFAGAVPPTLFTSAFPSIDVFLINNNRFSISLPTDFGRITAKYITLANNHLSGRIPRSIGNANRTLTEIVLLNNKLYDCIPYEIGNLRKARVFDVSKNKLKGTLPYSLACMAKIEQLVFADNRLRGSIPEVLCGGELGRLLNFDLSFNYFTELGPQCLNLSQEGVLNVQHNCIPGLKNQRPDGECNAFLAQPFKCPFPSTYRILPCILPVPSAPAALRPSAMSFSSYRDASTVTYRALHRNR